MHTQEELDKAILELYKDYKDAFKDLPVKMNPYLERSQPNFWLSCMIIDKGVKVTPMEIIDR